MKLWLMCALAFTLTLTACRPADQKVKSVKERLEGGELVEFTKPGYRRPSCSERTADWTDVRLNDESERERIVMKLQSSALNPGRHSCFRIGSTILLKSPQMNRGAGQVRLTKLSIIRAEKLTARNLKGSFFAKADDAVRFLENAKVQLKPEDEGIVTIVDFEYVSGSAPDEQSLRDAAKTGGQ